MEKPKMSEANISTQPKVKLRPYQEKLLNLVLGSDKHTLAVASCGAGKSVVMSQLVQHLLGRGKQPLFLTHRNNLLDQFEGHLKKADVNCDVMSPQRALNSPKQWDTIIIDEAHHATSTTFQRVFEKYPHARRIGFTATPIRLSGERLARPINKFQKAPFEEVFQTVSIRELVSQNFLAPFEVKALDYTLFFDKKTIKAVAGEFSSKSIAEAFKEKELPNTVKTFLELAKDRKVIAYTPTIDMAEALATELNKQGVKAKAFHSKLSKKQVDEYIEDFKANRLNVCVNVDLFGEGFDVPDCDCVWMLRPTKSLSLYIQQFMRAMRIDPKNPEKKALIVDFANNTKTHGGLYTAELRMNLKQSDQLLKMCPICETLNYAKSRKCDNPTCGYVWKAGNQTTEQQKAEEVKLKIQTSVVDYTIEDELKSISRIPDRETLDITTRYISRYATYLLSKTDPVAKSKLKQEGKFHIYHGIKDITPKMEVINLFLEQIGQPPADIEFFRKAYAEYQMLKKRLEKQREAESRKRQEQKNILIRHLKKQLENPYLPEATKKAYIKQLRGMKQYD